MSFNNIRFILLLLSCILLCPNLSIADGSKDLYPVGVKGGRAKLRSSSYVSNSFPFPQVSAHYVYAKAGETIAMAHSEMGYFNAGILLTRPNGTKQTKYTGKTAGLIANRAQELAGPRAPNSSNSNQYLPVYYVAKETGVHKVEFIPAQGGTANSTGDGRVFYLKADAEWLPSSHESYDKEGKSVLLSAWDVSVFDLSNTLKNGRVYTDVLNMEIPLNNRSNDEGLNFYGKFFVLTNTGYLYRVDNNGNNGYGFTFFVNNKGFYDKDKTPLYESINEYKAAQLADKIHDPRIADTESDITHKMFYSRPDPDMPEKTQGSFSGGERIEWLRPKRTATTVENILIKGVDGTVGQVSHKGGNIFFSTNNSGTYTVEISSSQSPAAFKTRKFSGTAVTGPNSIPWDGKDGDGNPVPPGRHPVNISVKLQNAEVHFPYFDMEINPEGIILELLAVDEKTVVSDKVYWNDENIIVTNINNQRSKPNPLNASHLVNPAGVSSRSNGHIWGLGTGQVDYGFGNDRSIDTWTFITGEEKTEKSEINVKVADLKITRINPSATSLLLGEIVQYTVVASNDGPSDVEKAPFAFNLPQGFKILNVAYQTSCAAGVVTEYDGQISAENRYDAKLDLPNGCAISYVFDVGPTAAALPSSIIAEATILRPYDVTDPDATNPKLDVPPTDPYYECEHNGLNRPCNNILSNNIVIFINQVTAVKRVSGEAASIKPGEQIKYEIVLTNPNTVEVSGITVADEIPVELENVINIQPSTGLLSGNSIRWQGLSIPAGQTMLLSFEATVKKDIPVTSTAIVNTAIVHDPNFPDKPKEPMVETKLINPSIRLIKESKLIKLGANAQVGDKIGYTFTVLNTGNINLTNLSVVEQAAQFTGTGSLPTPVYVTGSYSGQGAYIRMLRPGETAKYTADYAISQQDIDAGKVINRALASGTYQDGIYGPKEVQAQSSSQEDTDLPTETELLPNAVIALLKSADLQLNSDGVSKPGDIIKYTFKVTNNGNVSLRNITVKEQQAKFTGSGTLPVPSYVNSSYTGTGEYSMQLLPGESATYSADYQLVQADIDAGLVSNQAISSGEYALDKMVDAVSSNLANPTGEEPTEVPILKKPKINLDKTSIFDYEANQNIAKPGDKVTYTFKVQNTGNTTLTAIEVEELTFSGTGIPPLITYKPNTYTGVGNYTNQLLPNESASYEATYEITQDDINNSKLVNTALAKGFYGLPQPVEDQSEAETFLPTESAIRIVKSASYNPGPTGANIDDIIDYTFTVINTGNVELSDLQVSEESFTGDGPLPQAKYLEGSYTGLGTYNKKLLPGERASYTAQYFLRQADINAGLLSNQAKASAMDPQNQEVMDYSSTIQNPDGNEITVTPISQKPGIQLEKSSYYNAGDQKFPEPGDKIYYTFKVTNTGNLTLDNITVSEISFNGENGQIPTPTPVIDSYNGPTLYAGSLNPGETVTYKAEYSIVQGDIEKPNLTNIASASGSYTDASGTLQHIADEDEAITELDEGPVIQLVKSSELTMSSLGYSTVGDMINYTFDITNTGNVTLEDINIFEQEEHFTGTGMLPINLTPMYDTYTGSDKYNFKLFPKESIRYIAHYATTQADIDAGIVSNRAKVTSMYKPNGGPASLVEDESSTIDNPTGNDPTHTIIGQIGKIHLIKSGNIPAAINNVVFAGDNVAYRFEIENTGNVTLSSISLLEGIIFTGTGTLPEAQYIPDSYNNGEAPYTGKLAPGETVAYQANYPLTQADIESGKLFNQAEVSGIYIDRIAGTTIVKALSSNLENPEEGATEIDIPQKGVIYLLKSASLSAPQGKAHLPGDLINYTFTVSNKGNMPLRAVEVLEQQALFSGTGQLPTPVYLTGSYSGGNYAEELLPAESASYTASYALTQADINAGTISNRALSTAMYLDKDGHFHSVEAESSADGSPIQDQPTEITIPQDATLSLIKSSVLNVAQDKNAKVGDLIDYSFLVTNTGNVSLTAISLVEDPAIFTGTGGLPVPTFISGSYTGGTYNNLLNPGESASYKASYALTAADIQAGKVVNQAIVKGTYIAPTTGAQEVSARSTTQQNPTAEDPTETNIIQVGSISLIKTSELDVSAADYSLPGDQINYTFVVTNTGNMPLSDIMLTEQTSLFSGTGTVPVPVYTPGSYTGGSYNNQLLPQESATYNAKYTLTQDDIDAGTIFNKALAEGLYLDPNGKPVEVMAESTSSQSPNPNAPTETVVILRAAISLTKSFELLNSNPVANALGDKIQYRFDVENTGNVSLTGINIIEPKDWFTGSGPIPDPQYTAGSYTGIGTYANVLRPGEKASYTATYLITQVDLNLGVVKNGAIAAGHYMDTDGSERGTADISEVETFLAQAAHISLIKSSTLKASADRSAQPGDLITYSFSVRNSGNVALANISLLEDKSMFTGTGALPIPSYLEGSYTAGNYAALLQPGEEASYTAQYSLTQADIDAGTVQNQAQASGNYTDSKGAQQTITAKSSSDQNPFGNDPTETLIPRNPGLLITKSAQDLKYNRLGQKISYTIQVQNTGNVVLHDLEITDTNADPNSLVPATIATLEPNEQVQVSASHTLTQADIDAGYVYNLAVVKGNTPDPNTKVIEVVSYDPNPIDPTALQKPGCPTCTIVPIEQNPSVALVKEISNTGSASNGDFMEGDNINYKFTIYNTGNTTLKDFQLTDNKLNMKEEPVSNSLAPGQEIGYSASYKVKQEDILAGQVTNSAFVTAKAPDGSIVKDQSGTAIDNDNPTIVVISRGPTAVDDKATTLQQVPVSIPVLANDIAGSTAIDLTTVKLIDKVNGTAVQAYIIEGEGKFTVQNNGQVLFAPQAGFSGSSTISYQVADRNGLQSNLATITVTIPKSQPVAVDDRAETNYNTAVSIAVLDNDIIDGAAFDPQTIAFISNPQHGTIQLNTDGTVSYTPEQNYTGKDEFSYRVRDINGNWTNVANVYITVNGFFIPNVITPNGDGKNDNFVVIGLDSYDRGDLIIVNRWGNQVYANPNYGNEWNAKGLNSGVYYYILQLFKGANKEVFKGYIQVIK